MLRDAGLDGFFTNHSLCRTAATRLFQAGQNVKIIKEVTGHISNAVEKYEITSDQQRMDVSSIIQGEKKVETELKCSQSSNLNVPLNVHLTEESKKSNSTTIQNTIEGALNVIGNRKAWLSITIDLIE